MNIIQYKFLCIIKHVSINEQTLLTELSTSAKSWTLSKGDSPSGERGTKFLSTFRNSLTSGLEE